MTFLELINRARRECGVSGAAVATVVNQIGETQRFVDWVATAWSDIQLLHDEWQFLNQPFDFPTTAGKQTYLITDPEIEAAAPGIRSWDPDKFRIYTDAVNYGDEMILPYMDWPTFRNTYQYAQSQTNRAKPSAVAVDPHFSLLFGNIPDQVYRIRGRYWRWPQELVLDTDVPLMPEPFHILIVYKVMMDYGAFEAAPEVYNRGETKYDNLLLQLQAKQLPPVTFGAPLA